MRPEPIDLRHQATERVIGVYLLDTPEGPALFDCGPAVCIAELERGLAERGLELDGLRHLLLSHIHLDHAGAAGELVRRNPDLQVHVSPVGAPHLTDPRRLERSARRLYGESFDTLWGELAPVPERNVHPVGETVVSLAAFPTPGHASHHVSYLDEEGTLYAGDAAGVRLVPTPHVHPASPPPNIDLERWEATLDELERRSPERLALIHFGVAEDVSEHLALTREQLRRWAERVESGMSEEEFVRIARAELGERAEDADHWEKAGPLWQSYAGLRRYWDKRAETEAAASASSTRNRMRPEAS
jgi:glyoxylase-like metal-dependent hydrolase (beta-lactamase superfamily II)